MSGSLRTVLVTGASGFLGSNLCRRLLDDGAEVHATSRSARTSDDPRLHWWQSDLASEGAAVSLLREIRPDVVYHLAGQVSAAPGLPLVQPAFHSLLGSTVHLLGAAAQEGCRRVIVTGSLTEPWSNGPEVVPTSPYAAAKWASSAYARMFHALYETPVVILRPFMAYGPRQREEKLVPHVILSLQGGMPPKLASGDFRADWIYVDDVIEGFARAASQPGIEGATLDLGTGVMTSTRDLVRRIVARAGSRLEPQFGVVPDRPDEPVRAADVDTARQRLGWQARISLDEGIDRTIAWFRAHPLPGLRAR